jgi:outer membrane protein assembly factor BamA
MRYLFKYILLLLLLLYCSSLFSQKTKSIIIVDTLAKPVKIFSFEIVDSVKIDKKIKFIVDSLNNSGYLSPQIIEDFNDSTVAVISGVQYKWAKIDFSKDDEELLSLVNYDISNLENKYISPKEISFLSEKILFFLENSGYPFSDVKMDSIVFENTDSISAKLVVRKNKKIYFDSINVVSGIDLSSKYLENYLEIKKGDVFDKRMVEKAAKKLGNLPFVTLSNPPTVSFFGSGATLNLNLKEKKVNRFDFLLGLIPDNTGVRKYKLTGEITAEFLNKLGSGEKIYFNYKNMAQGRQNLILNLNYPFILDMPYGLDSKFNIFINEDQYRDVNLNLGVQYLFKGVNYVKTYWKLFSSRLLTVDSASILSLGRLPDKLDIVSNSVGMQLGYKDLDYFFNPGKGIEIVIDANAGQRKIIKNLQIINLLNQNIDFSNSYDSLKIVSYVFNIAENISFYYPLNSKIVLKIANKSAWKKSANRLYQNELFRLGGNKLLRGFDEESIPASIYSVSTAEIRLLIDRNSFLFAFMDYAYIYNPFSTASVKDTPFGTGVGVNFDTKGGILSIAAAVGKQYENPLDFKNIKIHIGYVSLF